MVVNARGHRSQQNTSAEGEAYHNLHSSHDRCEIISDMIGRPPTNLQTFLANTRRQGDCWIWTGVQSPDGYGRASYHHKTFRAHRLSWMLHFGPIPQLPHANSKHGTCVCHKCDTPLCVNPDHLFLGSMADNWADRIAKGRATLNARTPAKLAAVKVNIQAAHRASVAARLAKTECKNGHDLTPDNIYAQRGKRECRMCRKIVDRRRQLRKQEHNRLHGPGRGSNMRPAIEASMKAAALRRQLKAESSHQ